MLVAVAGCAERSTRQTVVLAGLAVLVQWAAEAYLGGWVHVETRQARTLLGNRVRSGHSVVVLQTGSAVREISCASRTTERASRASRNRRKV